MDDQPPGLRSDGRHEKPRIRDNLRKGVYVLPNLFTTASLFFGFFSIISAMKGNYLISAYAIIVSAFFDATDGTVARLTNTTSLFGIEYDSLSDLVAFGVAPAILAYKWKLEPFGKFGWLAAFLYLAAGALRLGRFNVQARSEESVNFTGLPIPGAAGMVASLVLFYDYVGISPIAQQRLPELNIDAVNIAILVLIYILSFLMVSTFKYPSSKNKELFKRRQLVIFFVFIALLTLVIAVPKVMFFAIFVLYVSSGICISFYSFLTHKKTIPQSSTSN